MKKVLFLCFLLFTLSSNCIGILEITSVDKGASDDTLMALGLLGAGGTSGASGSPAGGGTSGPRGATITSSDGQFSVFIPDGAMKTNEDFTITKYTPATNALPSGFLPTTPVYEITPSYLFEKDVTVTLALNISEIQNLNLDKVKSTGFSSSSTAEETESARLPGWRAHLSQASGDKLVFTSKTFSIFGGGTPTPGNLPPTVMGAFYYFKPGCSYLPYRVRTQVIEPNGDSMNVYLITGPAGSGASAINMTQEGATSWYRADIPYEAMVNGGIYMQVLAVDAQGANTAVPGSGLFTYPANSGNPVFISNFDTDANSSGVNNNLLCAWEVDNPAGNTADNDNDGIPNSHDYTPNGESNPSIDLLTIFPNQALMDVNENVTFAVQASLGGSPRIVNANFVTTGNGLGGAPVGTLSGSVFHADVPGVAGIIATVDTRNDTATVTVSDTVGPNNITNLTASAISHTQIRLNWTAPGNDGNAGTASVYEIRRSNSPITNNLTCDTASAVAHGMFPKPGGIAEQITLNGMSPNSTYYFCLRAFDTNGNRNSWVSSVVSATTFTVPDLVAPSNIAGAVATALTPNSIKLDWNAVGDDGMTGSASVYEIKRSTAPIINDSQCTSAVNILNTVSPAASGSPLTFTVNGLSDLTVYYFCIRAYDSSNNRGIWSGLLTATTPKGNLSPIANAGADSSGNVGSPVNLDASASIDPDATVCGANTSNYVYSWTLAAKPPLSSLNNASIVGANTLTPNFTPDVPGDYTFQFSFTDHAGVCLGGNQFDLDQITISATVNNSGTLDWTRMLGVAGVSTTATGITSDSSGNVYTTGHTYGNLDGQTLTGVSDLFVVKYNSSGVKQWTRLLGVSGFSTLAYGITSDSSGNVYTTGHTRGNLDGHTLTGMQDLFVVKYNSSGVKQWTRLLGVPGFSTFAYGITSDSSGNVYTTGIAKGNLDGQTVSGVSDLFIVKYNSSGVKQWTRLLGVPGTDPTVAQTYGYGITSDSTGNVYTTGITYGNLDGQTHIGGAWELFVVKYNSSGVKQWTRMLGVPAGLTWGWGITSDSSGNVYTTGNADGVGNLDLDGQTFSGGIDLVVVKYNSSGVKQWTRLLGVSGQYTDARGITSDSSGNVYATGLTNGNLDGQTKTGSMDLVVVKFNSNGVKQWTRLLGVSGADTIANGIASDSSGNLYSTGSTSGNLDGQTLTGISDLFVVKYR